MKKEKDYVGDIAAIRSMMERTTKFLSLSGWAGIMAGMYALVGAGVAYTYLDFNPGGIAEAIPDGRLQTLMILALAILILAIGTAVSLSYRKAAKQGERIWNATSRRLLVGMSVPLVTGGMLILVLIWNGLIGLAAPFSLIFYGLALYNAGNFTYGEVRTLGLIEIGLGLISAYFVEYSLLCWAIGFGLLHIIYGIYIHYKYER